jgi:hypothetical protein
VAISSVEDWGSRRRDDTTQENADGQGTHDGVELTSHTYCSFRSETDRGLIDASTL